MPDRLVSFLSGFRSEATFCSKEPRQPSIVPVAQKGGKETGPGTHKIGQVGVAVGVKQHVVGLDVSMDNVLAVDVSNGAAQLGHPEPHGFLGEGLARDVKSQIASCHEIDDDIPDLGRSDQRRLEDGAGRRDEGRTGTRYPENCSVDCR